MTNPLTKNTLAILKTLPTMKAFQAARLVIQAKKAGCTEKQIIEYIKAKYERI